MSSIKKNYVLQLSYQILNMLLPFVTSPYISRVLGAENLGVFSYSYSVANIFILFINLGIEKYGSRAIAVVKKNKMQLNCTFSEILLIRLVFGFIVGGIYLLYVFVIPTNKLYASINFFLVLAAIFDVNWFFWGIEKFKITVTRNFIFKLVTVILVFLLIKRENDLWKYCLIMAAGTAVSQSAVWFILPQYVNITKVKLKHAFVHFKPILILFVAVLASSAYMYIDKIMLGMLSTMEQLGYCDNAYKVISFPMGIITSLGTVMMPRMSVLAASKDNDHILNYIELSMRYVMILALGMCGGLIAVGKLFSIIFWGSEFATSGDVIAIIAPIVLFMSWSDIIRNQYLIPNKMDKEYMTALIVGAVVSIVSNAIFIPYFGADGAAAGTVLTYFSITLYQTFVTRKLIPYFRYLKTLIPFFLFTVWMVIVLRIYQYINDDITVINLLLQIITGAFVYGVCVLIYMVLKKDKMVFEILNSICRHI